MRTPATAEFRLRLDFKAASLLAINQMLVSHLVRLDLRCASKLTERFSRKHNTLSEGLVQDPSEMMFCRFAADCATQHRYLARSASARRPASAIRTRATSMWVGTD
jgi:hypothetical protein